MLKLTALASQSLLLRKTVGKCSVTARSFDTRVFGHGQRSSCLFSSLSVDSDSSLGGGKLGIDDENASSLATKKAEKDFKGLTRMRLRKALKTAQSGNPSIAQLEIGIIYRLKLSDLARKTLLTVLTFMKQYKSTQSMKIRF